MSLIIKNMVILETQNLCKTYKGGFKALSNVNIKVQENSFLALLGKNGAGKTTFVGILSSLIQKTSGKVFIFNKDLDNEKDYIKRNISIVPQEFNLPIFETPMQILLNYAGYFGITRKIAFERAIFYLRQMDLYRKRNTQVMSLSGGMKRRLMLARSLMNDPKILFLDEPTAGVDVEIRYKIWDFLSDLHNKGKAIILTTHYLEEVERLCDTVAFIDQGKIKKYDSINNIKSTQYTVTITGDLNNIPQQSIERLRKGIKVVGRNTIKIPVKGHNVLLNNIVQSIMDLGIKIENISTSQNKLESMFYNNGN